MRYPASEYVLPWRLARNLFKPERAYADTTVARLRRWRSWLGAAVIVFLSLPVRGVRGIVDAFLLQALLNVLLAAMVVIGSIALVAVAVAGTPPERAALIGRARGPLKRMAFAVAVFALGYAVSRVALPAVLAVPVYLWYLVFLLAVLWFLARYLFGADDVHPILGPVVSGLTVLGATGLALTGPVGAYGALLAIGGLVSVLGLAVAEAVTLRDTLRHETLLGYGEREVPPPTVAPPAWRAVELPDPDVPVPPLDTTIPGRASLGQGVRIAMEMDRLWSTGTRDEWVRLHDGAFYRIDKDAAALAYETIALWSYRRIVLPARDNIARWHHASGFQPHWRGSRRLADAIARYDDGRWVATPVPAGWDPRTPPMDDRTAGDTAWALHAFREQDIWDRRVLPDDSVATYRSAKPWSFAVDRRITARLAMALGGDATGPATELLRIDTGLTDPARDWDVR